MNQDLFSPISKPKFTPAQLKALKMKEFEANTKRMIKEKKEAKAQWLYDNRPYSPPPYEFEVPDMSEQPMPAISVIPPNARKIKSLDEAQKEKRL